MLYYMQSRYGSLIIVMLGIEMEMVMLLTPIYHQTLLSEPWIYSPFLFQLAAQH